MPPSVNPKAAKDATLPTWNNYWTLANAGPLANANTISGKVTDVLGNPLVGVTVTARWSSGATLSVTSAADGTYSLAAAYPNVPVTVTAAAQGNTFGPVTVSMAGQNQPNVNLIGAH